MSESPAQSIHGFARPTSSITTPGEHILFPEAYAATTRAAVRFFLVAGGTVTVSVLGLRVLLLSMGL